MRGRHSITFHEYSGFKKADGEISDSIADMNLRPEMVRCLQALSDSLVPRKSVFDFSSTTIRARSLVGVLNVAGTQIEILPKLLAGRSEDAGASSILRNLMFMLSYTHALDVQDTGVAILSKDFGSFIDIYISIFADRLNQMLVRHGVPKKYEDCAENLSRVRGKIGFARNSVLNIVDKAKVFCEFSEFTEDNLISRALKYVSVQLERQSRSVESQRKLQRCIGLLEGVQASFVEPDALERASFGRRDPNFAALVQLTKMFLSRMRPQFGKGPSNQVFALLFDMNDLFEEFIFEVLRRHAGQLQIEVRAQKRKRLVTAERNFVVDAKWEDRSLFDTYTDIEIRSLDSGVVMILDTKYKLVGDGAHYGVGNADAYQILAYKQIHTDGKTTPNVGLLYPKFRNELRKEFRVNGKGPTFFAVTIDLSRDLGTSLPALVSDLASVIEAGRMTKVEAAG